MTSSIEPQAITRKPAWRRAVSAILLIVAAGALERSTTSPWGSATGPGESRIEVSPIGITRADAGGRQLCRWWPVTGDASLCRVAATPAAQAASGRLRMAYPLLQIGFWSAMIALFLVVLRTPRRRSVRVGLTLFAVGCAVAGALGVVVYAPATLEVLNGIPLSFRLSGALLAGLGALAATASAMLQLTDG